ncbi:MAG: DUF4340 domain-containing protein [Bacteroidales bacterium]
MKIFHKKNKSLIIITIILAIVAVIIIFTQKSSTLDGKEMDFDIQDTASITKIHMSKKDSAEVFLIRQNNTQWMIGDDVKASGKAVEILLETLKKMDVRRPVGKTEHNSVMRRLSSLGVKVEVYQQKPLFRLFGIDFFNKERKTKTFYVGDATQNNRGTYMMMENANTPYIVHIPGFRGYLSPRFKAKTDKWRDHTMIAKDIHEIQSVEVRHPEQPEESFRINKPDENTFEFVRLHDNKPMNAFDTLKVLDFLSSFQSVKFEDLINDFEKRDSIVNSQPFHIIRLTDMSDNTYEIKTYHRKFPEGKKDVFDQEMTYDPDRMYALFNQETDFALVQFYTFDHITRKLSYFLPHLNFIPQQVPAEL